MTQLSAFFHSRSTREVTLESLVLPQTTVLERRSRHVHNMRPLLAADAFQRFMTEQKSRRSCVRGKTARDATGYNIRSHSVLGQLINGITPLFSVTQRDAIISRVVSNADQDGNDNLFCEDRPGIRYLTKCKFFPGPPTHDKLSLGNGFTIIRPVDVKIGRVSISSRNTT